MFGSFVLGGVSNNSQHTTTAHRTPPPPHKQQHTQRRRGRRQNFQQSAIIRSMSITHFLQSAVDEFLTVNDAIEYDRAVDAMKEEELAFLSAQHTLSADMLVGEVRRTKTVNAGKGLASGFAVAPQFAHYFPRGSLPLYLGGDFAPRVIAQSLPPVVPKGFYARPHCRYCGGGKFR